MSERQLPWRAERPLEVGLGFRVVDDAGVLVCTCSGDDDGREESVAICVAINRTGDTVCANCGEDATCFGSYEDELHPAYACDECCGHWNEDGHCERLEDADDDEPLSTERKGPPPT